MTVFEIRTILVLICYSQWTFFSIMTYFIIAYHTFAWHFPLIKAFQHRVANHRAWSFWPGMHFDSLVRLFTEVGFIIAFFRIRFYLICLVVFCRWLQIVLMINRSSFTRITIEFYINLMMMMVFRKSINCFSKFNFRTFLEIIMFKLFFNSTSELLLMYWDTSPLTLFVWRKFFLGVSKSRHAGSVLFANSATCFDVSSGFYGDRVSMVSIL